jgi:predicted phage baseplate assembly protein
VPLTPPLLDDRKFDDLFQEARLRVARYNSTWTDFNESDPGITLLQLFAWLTEMMLYRMNQVPERNYLKFLQLLGLELWPAQPAVAALTFTPPKPGSAAVSLVTVPAGTQVGAQADDGSLRVFETEADLDVIPLPLGDVQVFDGSAFTSVMLSNLPTDQPFSPFGFLPQAGNALYLGFDVPPGFDPSRPGKGFFPALMRFRVFLTTDTKAVRAEVCRGGDPPPPPLPVKLAWEYKAKAGPDWRPLRTVTDDSLAFTREGDILVEGPAAPVATVEGNQTVGGNGANGKGPTSHFWLRVRVAGGSYPAGKEPEIDFLRPNTVAASNLTTVRFEQVGVSDGRPNQSLFLANTPVFPDTLRLSVQPAGAKADVWSPVPDFFGSGPDDMVYTVNLATGEIRFGDGRRGLVPPPGAVVLAEQYRYGGGSAGNVGAGQIKNPLTNLTGVDVKNERAAVGGSDEQNVEELKEEAPARLRCRDRAVTAADFEALAVKAGGVARAQALPLSHPDFPDPKVQIPGVVSVVIVPDTTDPNPTPSQDLIRSVCDYLDGYRLVTTEVYVKKPAYVKVSVKAVVQADPQVSPKQVGQDVRDAINSYLDPLGRTWNDGNPGPPDVVSARPFGQTFYPTRLFAVIQGVNGVSDVPPFQVTLCGQPLDLQACFSAPPDGLLYGADHQITVTAPDQSSTANCQRCL